MEFGYMSTNHEDTNDLKHEHGFTELIEYCIKAVQRVLPAHRGLIMSWHVAILAGS